MGLLSQSARKHLLQIARTSIAERLLGRAYDPPEPEDEALRAVNGAFVTLTLEGALRGCIGALEGRQPLYLTVADMARSAAFNDPRFPPLAASELPEVDVEISVLSPMKPIDDPEQIQMGRHGLLISRGGYRGVLLPQVPTKYGWDRSTFLEQACHKAGLPGNAWRHGAEISIFEAEIFGEGANSHPS